MRDRIILGDEVKTAFMGYVEKAGLHLRALSSPRPSGSLHVLLNKNSRLRNAVDELEETAEFNRLIEALDGALARNEFERGTHGLHTFEIKNFLRRSGFYSAAIEAEEHVTRADALLTKFQNALEIRKIRYTYLALIDVAFAEDRVTFADFAIRRFSSCELSADFQNGINQVFYPYAALDTQTLADYWFICAKEEVEESPFAFERSEEASPPVRRKFSSFPRPVEAAVGKLALYSWESLSDKEHWSGFDVPFVLVLTDNLLEHPAAAPKVDILARRPCFDPQTGEERGDEPDFAFQMGVSETSGLEGFIRGTESLATTIGEVPAWDFLDRASGYLVKAFFSEDLEQLLWHIATLEALTGQSDRAIASLRERVSLICQQADQGKKSVMNKVNRLYDLRSSFVHGSKISENESAERLFEGRSLARRTLVWFFHYLAHVRAQFVGIENLPQQKDLLRLLDLGQGDVPKAKQVLQNLPIDFPPVTGWS
jgi:hypothetical protein